MPTRFPAPSGAGVMSMRSLTRGPAATIAISATNTLAEGNSATVTNGGSSSAASLTFGIPRGAVPAIGFNFNTATTDSDKDAGDIWFNSATPASVTTIYFDNADRDGNTQTTWLDAMDDSTSTINGQLVLTPAATPSAKLVYNVTGSVTDGTGYRKVVVTHVSGTTLPSNDAHIAVEFIRVGDKGDTGADAVIPATAFNFNTATTDSDKDAGDIWFDNATPASVTVIYFDNADRDGNTVTSWLDSFDDSTDTSVKGTITLVPALTPSAKLIYNVTGSVVDGTGYRKVTVTHVAGTVLPSNDANIAVSFSRTGNKGTDGAGTGDVEASAAFTADNRLVRTDRPTSDNKNVQQSGITVDDSDNVSGMATLTLPNTGLHILDTNASHDLIVAPGSDLSADRTLTVTTGDADRTLTISGNATVSQDYSTSGNPQFSTIELSHASANTLSGSSGDLLIEGTILKKVGKETIWVPASAMVARTTNGAASGTAEMTTNKNMVKTLDFDASTQEFAQFEIAMPKSWNESTVTFQPVWSHASTTTNFGVVWALQAIARSDDDTLDVAFGTEQTSTDTGGTTNDLYIGPESSAITIGGTPAEGDVVQFQIKRNVSDGSDTMAIDARLHGVKVFFTTNASTDA